MMLVNDSLPSPWGSEDALSPSKHNETVIHNATTNCYATPMPAARLSCAICAGDFHGRKDARYCSTACRQKAYRRRNRSSNTVTYPASSGPVPVGDAWMRSRFGDGRYIGYTPIAERPSDRVRSARHRAAEQDDGSGTIRDYVQGICCIGRRLCDDDADYPTGQDLQTPLGDSLPAQIDPITAARLASGLEDAIPRVMELASLLKRRGRMTPIPMVPMKTPIASAISEDGLKQCQTEATGEQPNDVADAAFTQQDELG
ncbi:hypothetical protein ABGB19_14770 [Mycobacterium sp. B14F4]|uniref:hypothetical protein n=1 Tax=Mycobacterium sp. B14F4 TaxID=3153565 RepID=UPI00325E45F9